MGAHTHIGLLFLALVACSSAFKVFVPQNQEVIYEYEALIKSGTLYPAAFASEFFLNGKLHIQYHDQYLVVQFSDLKYKMYNGLEDGSQYKAQYVPMPAGVEDLYKSFIIAIDQSGLVLGIKVDKSEKLWSVNIKKSIAGILQMEFSKVQYESKKAHAFHLKEHSIYGPVEVFYNVLPLDHYVEVQKMIEMPDFDNLYTHSISPVNENLCDVPFQEPISYDAFRRYWIVEEDGHKYVSFIQGSGGVYYHPFAGQSEAQYILVNQTFNLIEHIPISKQFAAPVDGLAINDLSYIFFDEMVEIESVPYLNLGRNVIDQKSIIPKILSWLEDIWNYPQKDHLKPQLPNLKEGQVINQLKNKLMLLDYQHLTELYTQILAKPEEIQKIFYEVLPLAGTKASSLLILKLVQENKLDESIITSLLEYFPSYVVVPSQKLVVAMEGLIKLDDKYDWDIRKSAILAFGNLIGVSYEYLENVHNSSYFHYHIKGDNLVAYGEYEENYEENLNNFFNKYVKWYFEKMKESSDRDVQLAYIYGLSNMGLDIVLPSLIPIVKGEVKELETHRLSALWAYVTIDYDPYSIYKVLWPIFTNKYEPLELRIVAYWMIMENLPDMQTFNYIYWYMQKEPNPELYSFHYSYISSMSENTDVCHKEKKLYASQLLAYMHPPQEGYSEYILTNFMNIKYKWGLGTQAAFIQTNNSYIFNILGSSTIFNTYSEDWIAYVKIQGLELDWKSIMQENIADANALNKISKAKVEEGGGHVEIVVMSNQKVTDSYFVTFNEIKDLMSLPWLELFFTKDKFEDKSVMISYEKYVKTFLPTDIGMPALMEILLPSATYFELTTSKEFKNEYFNIHWQNYLINWIHSRHGLSIYNSFVDVWQGINKFHTYDIAFPLVFDFSYNIPTNVMKISFGQFNDPIKDVVGMRSHATSLVFVKLPENSDVLSKSCPGSIPWYIVSAGDKYRHNYPLYSEEDEYGGREWDMIVFDSEFEVTNGTLGYVDEIMSQMYTKTISTPWDHIVLSLLDWDTYVFMLPEQLNHGLLIRGTPLKDVSTIDLSIKWDIKSGSDKWTYTSGYKLNTKWSWAVKSQEKSLKSLHFNTVIDMNDGHTVNGFQMDISAVVPGSPEYKMCLDGKKKWALDKVTGHLVVGFKESGKCGPEDTILDIQMEGVKSNEQLSGNYLYGTCQYPMPFSIQPFNTLECMVDHSTVRKYTYNIKTPKPLPPQLLEPFYGILNMVKGYFFSHYDTIDSTSIKDNTALIEVYYPVTTQEVNMYVYTPKGSWSLTGLPLDYWGWFGFYPDSLYYPLEFYENLVQSSDYHVLHVDEQVLKQSAVNFNDWIFFIGNDESSITEGVYLKKSSNGKFDLKIVVDGHTAIMKPGKEITGTMDGAEIKENQKYEFLYWDTIKALGRNESVAIMFPRSGLFVEYDGWVKLRVPEADFKWKGAALAAL